jgi:hypothetical protein
MSNILVEEPSPWPQDQDKKQPEKKKRRAGVAWWWSLVFLAIAALVVVPIWYADMHAKKPVPEVAAAAPEAPAAPASAAPAEPAAAQPQEPQQPQEPEKTHAEKQKVENAYFFRIDGKDKQGHPASFDFIILTDEYTWAKGSTTDVVSADKVIPQSEVADRVLTPQVRASLDSASDLIAVGLASQEGERAQEEARAADRAKTVVEWIKKVSKPDLALWTLTLGQYDKACKHQEDADSSFERPVIFAGVRSKAADTNLQEALADAISGHDNLPSRECYSRFDLEKIQ